ncbi:MAG TPA: TonB-dependent receptor [Burkholderiales bacterium]|nr:TonB-dependent receptor [Burkholderiales bacterium]
MRSILLVSALCLAALPAAAQVTVKDPWVRATVPQQKATGAFMKLESPTDARLVSASSPAAGVVELHEMKMEKDVMTMRAVPSIAIPAGSGVELKPGGYHVMLMNLKGQVKKGDTVLLTLVVEGKDGKRQTVEVRAPVRPLNEAAGGGEHESQAVAWAQEQTLPEVVVRPEPPIENTAAGPVQGFRALSATSATRTDTPTEELPQNIQVIPRSVIDSQGAVSVSEAVKNASNVQPVDTRAVGNVQQDPVMIRGFGAEQWTDGYAGNLFLAGDRDGLVNVERIEVLKGPNALLYGGGAGSPVGGAINVISKMPMDNPRYEAGGAIGSYQYRNGYVDMNQPLNEQKTVLFRLTAENTVSDSFINVLHSNRYGINPTLLLTNRDDTSLTIQGFASKFRQQAYPGLPVDGTLFGAYTVQRSLYFGSPNIEPSYSKIQGATTTFDHRFNETWSTNIKLRVSSSEMNQNSQSPLLDATGTGGTSLIPPSTFDVNNVQVFDKQREFSINPTLKAKFAAGPSQNTLLLGVDYGRVKDNGFMNVDTLGNFCFLLGGPCPPALVDLSNPVFTVPYSRPVPGIGEGASFFNFYNTYITKGAYSQLQSTLYDRVHLVIGARLASINITYNENALVPPTTFKTDETRLLPRAGVVVDLTKALSVYASYGEGMKWVPFSQTFAQPAPELSKQSEAGLKFNLNDAFTGTLAAFDIERRNVPFTIAAGVGGLSTQKSRGFEADVIYQLGRNWSVLGSYGITDAYFADAAGSGVQSGNKLPSVPEQSGRLWVNYKFDDKVLPGWSAGGGVYSASSQYVDPQNRWKTDGYSILDARIGYETQGVRASLTVKNLTNRQYYTPYLWFGGQVAPGAPRTIYGQISVNFD